MLGFPYVIDYVGANYTSPMSYSILFEINNVSLKTIGHSTAGINSFHIKRQLYAESSLSIHRYVHVISLQEVI